MIPAPLLQRVQASWKDHSQLKQSHHLTAAQAVTLSELCSKTWDKGHQLQLKRELDLHQMDGGLL